MDTTQVVDESLIDQVTELSDFGEEDDFEDIYGAEHNEGEQGDDDFLLICGEKEQEIGELKLQLEKQADIVRALNAQIKAMTNKLENAEKLHEKELAFKDRLVAQKEERAKDIQNLMAKNEQTAATRAALLDAKVREHQRTIQLHGKEVDAAKAIGLKGQAAAEKAMEEKKQILATMELTKQEHRQQLKAKVQEAAQLQITVADLKRQLQTQAQQLQQQTTSMQECKKQLNTSKAQQQKQNVQLEAASKQVAALQAEAQEIRAELQGTKKTLSGDIAKRDRQIQSLGAKLDKMEVSHQHLEAVTEQQALELKSITTANRAAEQQLEQARCEVTDLKSQVNDLEGAKEQVAQLELQVKKEKQRTKEETKLKDQAEAKIEELCKQMDQAENTAKAKNAQLTSSLADSSKNVWALSSRASTLEAENNSLRTELGHLKETNRELSENMESSAVQHHQQMHLKAQENTRLLEKTAELEQQLRAEERKTNEQIAKVKALAQQQEQQMGDLGAQQRQSSLDMASSKAKVIDLTVELDKVRAELQQLSTKRTQEVQQRDNQLLEMTNVNETLEGTVRSLIASNSEKQLELERVRADLKRHQTEIAGLSTSLEKSEQQVTALEFELEDSKVAERQRSRDELQRIKGQHQRQVEELEKQIEDSARSVQAKTQQLTDQLTEKSKSVWTYSRSVSELKAEKKSLQADLERQQRELEQLTKTLDTAAEEHRKTLEQKVEEVTTQTERVSLLEMELRTQTNLVKSLEASVASLTEGVNGANAQEQARSTELEAAKQQVCSLESDLQRVQSELEEARQSRAAEADQNDSQVRILEATVSEAKARNSDLETTVAQLQQQQAISDAEVTKCRGEVAEAQQVADDMKQQVQSLTDEQESMRQEMKAKAQELSMNIEAKELEISAAKDEAKQKTQQLQDAAQEIRRLTEQLEGKSQKLMTMQQEVEELTRHIERNPSGDKPAKRQSKSQSEVSRIMQDNPSCIPIRCTRAGGCSTLPVLGKKKFVAPKDMTLASFSEHIQAKLGADKNTSMSVFVESDVPLPDSQSLQELHRACKHADGFLHLRYTDTKC